jgi:hypothetical protein
MKIKEEQDRLRRLNYDLNYKIKHSKGRSVSMTEIINQRKVEPIVKVFDEHERIVRENKEKKMERVR